MVFNDALREQLDQLPADIRVGVYAEQDGQTLYEQGAHEPQFGASLGKMAVIHARWLIAREPDRYEPLIVRPEDKVGGTGILRHFPDGYTVPLTSVERLMLSESDNTAAKMLVRWLGGPEAVNQALADSPQRIEITRLVPRPDLDDEAAFEFGPTTAQESVKLFKYLLRNPVYADALQRSHAGYGLRRDIDFAPPVLAHEQIKPPRWKRALRLPHQAPSRHYEQALIAQRVAAAFPSKEGVYDLEKDDFHDNVQHDVARIGEITIAVLTSGWPPELPAGREHPARIIQGRIGWLALKHQPES